MNSTWKSGDVGHTRVKPDTPTKLSTVEYFQVYKSF